MAIDDHRPIRSRRFRLTAITAAAAAAVALAAATVFGGSLRARAVEAPAAVPDGVLSVQGSILGVAATSASNAWAVGYAGYLDNGDAQMLIAHWNGARWSLTRNLPLGWISQVSMDAPNDAWALAEDNGYPYVIHWNGRIWSQDTSVPPVLASLDAVVTVGGDVWVTGPSNKTRAQVMLHRTHGRWYVVPVPVTASDGIAAFAAISPANIWAGGDLLVHWNGREWQRTSALKSVGLSSVGALSPGPSGSVWGVGGNGVDSFVSLHYNGRAWATAPFPRAAGLGNTVDSIAAIPHGTAWAVGESLNGSGSQQTALLLHWSGKAWTAYRPPATTQGSVALAGVIATSPSNAWAVGISKCIQEHCTQYATILHWNGRTWS